MRGRGEGETYIISLDGHDSREEENDRDKGRPSDSVDVDKLARPSEIPRARLEAVEEQLAQDGNAVRPVECDGAHVEDGRDGDVGPQPDEVDEHAQQGVDPHGGNGGVGARPYAVPDVAEGEHPVAREGPDGAAAGLHGGDADKVHDDESGDGEEDGRAFAHDVVEDLHDGLADGRGEDRGGAAHAEG